ncbi:MAG TPA: copper-binding protein [Casimicrobiaceae bacterium]|nr:copper-binding protein [Casimicrobiaceae bacterium]
MAATAQTVAPKMDMKAMDQTASMDSGKKSEATHSGTGIVKGVDPTSGSVTLTHEPIKSLNWSAMTMAFKVQDKKMLEKVKPGEKVHFTLVQSGKEYTITEIK